MVTVQPKFRDALQYFAEFTCSTNSRPRVELSRLSPALIRQDRIMWVNKIILLVFLCTLKVSGDL